MKKRRYKIFPLLNILGEWRLGNRYPERVRIPMCNGVVATYGYEVHAERICTGKHGWEETGTQVVGYKMKPPVIGKSQTVNEVTAVV